MDNDILNNSKDNEFSVPDTQESPATFSRNIIGYMPITLGYWCRQQQCTDTVNNNNNNTSMTKVEILMQALTYRHKSTLAYTTTLHIQTHTTTHTDPPMPAYTVATTAHWLYELIWHIYDENYTLKYQVAELTPRCNTLTWQVSNVSLQ